MSAVQSTTNSEELVTADELCALHSKLERLATHHHAALNDENAVEQVEKLLKWVEACEQGSSSAERKLYHEGVAMLDSITQRLQLALDEELRMVDESPAAAATARGRTAERYAKASSRSKEAFETLQAIAENK